MPGLARRNRDIVFALGLLALLILFFWPQTIGPRTLLPTDILSGRQPWQASLGSSVETTPYNGLVADLLLENYAWKLFILQSLQRSQLPLWNPYILSGVPFLAGGQHSALYPFSLIYYIFPLPRAYGLFTVSQMLLAGLSLYYLARTLDLTRLAAAAGALVFAFSGFMLVSTVFPMILAVAAWLPFLLATLERLAQASASPTADSASWRQRLRASLPWVILGSLALGIQSMGSHAEFAYYTMLVLVAYAIWRGVQEFVPVRRWGALLRFAISVGAMVALGLGLGAVQLLPYYELVATNFREGSATYQQIVDWAYKPRQVLAFLVPDFFGNPVHHGYVDLWTGQTVRAWKNLFGQDTDTVFWGVKNYVEAGAYLSLLSLLLALVAALKRPRRQVWFFIALALFSLTLVFGLPTYRLIFALPGIRQLHSPFRWVFPYTVCMATLTAMGVDALRHLAAKRDWRLATWLGGMAVAIALLTLALVVVLRLFGLRLVSLADQLVNRFALANATFSGGRMFLSYEARNLVMFAGCLLAAGLILLTLRFCVARPWREMVWAYALLVVLVLDPTVWLRPFQPAEDPAPLAEQPAAINFLQHDSDLFRITVFDTRDSKPLPANTSMYYDLQDVRGYDSVIPKWYTEVMGLVEPQGELEYNQVARLTHPEALDSPILDMLNVRYILTQESIDHPHCTEVYADGGLRVYRNDDALPRAWVVFAAQAFSDRSELLSALPRVDLRHTVLLEESVAGEQLLTNAPVAPKVEFVEYSPNQVRLHVNMPAAGYLVLADNYFPGWAAFTMSDGTTEERELAVLRADGTLRAVKLPVGAQTVRFTYAPGSVKAGLFFSFMAGVSLLSLVGFWLHGRFCTSRGAGSMHVERSPF